MNSMQPHEKYMRRCLQLALLGMAEVAPNPMVGAVLVHNDMILGEGYHQKYGGPHAEVECIRQVQTEFIPLISSATLYVSLEPCNHEGKTPPCTDLIIKSNIRKVVVACRDPYEKVRGSGIQTLKNAGIEVIESCLENEAKEINRRFFTFHQQQRPYIILKWAQTKDRFIGIRGKCIKISNPASDRLVHKWRSEEAAILVGTQTALVDNPMLTNRLHPGKSPVRILIDLFLEVPQSHHLLMDANPTIIINTLVQDDRSQKMYYKVGEDENVLAVIINLMHQRNLTSLIVEGGATTIQGFIDAGLWDEARVITGDISLHDGIPSPAIHSSLIKTEIAAGDTIETFMNAKGNE